HRTGRPVRVVHAVGVFHARAADVVHEDADRFVAGAVLVGLAAHAGARGDVAELHRRRARRGVRRRTLPALRRRLAGRRGAAAVRVAEAAHARSARHVADRRLADAGDRVRGRALDADFLRGAAGGRGPAARQVLLALAGDAVGAELPLEDVMVVGEPARPR